MKAKEFAEKFPALFNKGVWESYYCRGVNVMEYEVNYFLLLAAVPLWRFRELYNEWYAEKDKTNEAGAMGDFMDDTPDDETIVAIAEEALANWWNRNM